MILMPFGKFKRRPLNQVPTSYLAWLLELDDLGRWWGLKEHIQAELHRRLPCPNEGAGMIHRDELKKALRTWFHRQALLFHPDRGGSNETMRAIIDSNKLLEEIIDQS
jgi:hypothetical protein